jgi:signal transduction histidine kinase
MMGRSIRVRVALAAAGLSSLIVIVFAAASAAWFYHEQLDAMAGEVGKPSARQVFEARDEVRELALAYLAVLPLAAALVAAGAWWLAGRLTDPLIALTQAAERIDARSLSERLPEPSGTDEISRLARVLNGLLTRLERSFLQANRFAADASHELRTPLAIMRGLLEQAIQAEPSGRNAPVLVSVLEENQRLAAITEKLLLLARADAGELVAMTERVNLSELIEDIASDFAILAESRTLTMECKIANGVFVQGDAHLLRHLILNLFDNAATHNQSGGWIKMCLETVASQTTFTISNSGPPISEAGRARLFERFYRAAASRRRHEGGAGLGLSLCREIAAGHGGSLSLVESDDAGTVFRAVFWR